MPSDRTTRVGLLVGLCCLLVVTAGAVLLALRSIGGPVVACPAVAWGTTVVVEVTGAVERVAVVELVPVGAASSPPVLRGGLDGGGPAADGPDIGPWLWPGPAERAPDGTWVISSWGGSSSPDGSFPDEVDVRAWSDGGDVGLVLAASRTAGLRFERVGGDAVCGGPGEARVALEVPPAA
jgi:hypothetical protein